MPRRISGGNFNEQLRRTYDDVYRKDEEIFVSYNYTVSAAPQWYQQLWLSYLM